VPSEPCERIQSQSWTFLALAKSIGVSRQTINMIENGKYNPSLDLCINLAKELGTDLNSLFWRIDDDE